LLGLDVSELPRPLPLTLSRRERGPDKTSRFALHVPDNPSMVVLIVGAGGHGKVVLDILRAAGEHNPIGFIDADTSLAGTTIGGLPVFGPANQLPKLQRKCKAAIIAIGDNRTRRSYAQTLIEQGFELVSAIHPTACVSSSARIGKNVVVAAGAIVCAEAVIADSAIVNTAAVVDHECEIGCAAHVCPTVALAGRVRIGEGAFVGLGAKVIPCISIGEHATIGAGAVVIQDIPANATALGVPAKVVKRAPKSAAA
jgi:UDP-perosamine 4-acetyltransferase